MRFYCEQCHTSHVLRDDKIGPYGTRLRCWRCNHLNHVPGRTSSEQASAGGPTAPGAVWLVAMGTKQVGPLTAAQVKQRWECGDLRPESLCYREGLPGWVPLSCLPELVSLLAPAPRPRAGSEVPSQERAAAVAATAAVPAAAAISVQAAATPELLTPAAAPAASAAPAPEAPPHTVATPPGPAPRPALPAALRRLAGLPRPSWKVLGILVGGLELALALALWLSRSPAEAPLTPAPPPRPMQVAGPVAAPAPLEKALPAPAPPPAPLPVPRASSAGPPRRSPPLAVTPREVKAQTRPSHLTVPAPKMPAPDHEDPATDNFDEVFARREHPEPLTLPITGAYQPKHLSREAVMRVVVQHKSAVVRCVGEQRRREPDLGGTLVMRWTILPSGGVTQVAPRTPELGESYLADCLKRLIESWRFPSHRQQGEPVDFSFKF